MLELYNTKHEKIAPLPSAQQLHICKTLEFGDETLDFIYRSEDAQAENIAVEDYLRTPDQEYVIKNIDKKSTAPTFKVTAVLNIEGLLNKNWIGGCETVEQNMADCLNFLLDGTGWTAQVPQEIAKLRTVRIEEDTDTWEMIKAAVTTYRVELEIDSINKTLIIHTQRGQNRGAYFLEGLNLTELGQKTSSYGFYTRLIPMGKDGLSLWVGGKNYIDNHQYTDKIVTKVWSDERYTNTNSLLEDATARLEEASRPAVAYSAKIIDLAALNDKYSILDYGLGDTVLICSERLGTRVPQRIVKIDAYPDDHTKDKVELSNVKQTFAQLQKQGDELAKQEAITIAQHRLRAKLGEYSTTEETNTAIRAMQDAIQIEVNKTFTTKAESAKYVEQAQADAAEALQAATDLSEAARIAAEAAARNYTDGQLVDYATTASVKSSIDTAVGNITLSVSENYATKATVDANATQAAADAAAAQQAAADLSSAAQQAAETTAKGYTDGRLTEYITTTDAESKINVAMGSITLEVSQKYATQKTVDANATQAAADAAAAQQAAETTAKGYTDGRLTEYITTTDAESKINVAMGSITLEVSQKYATQATVDANKTQAAADAAAAQQTAADLSSAAQTAAEATAKGYTDGQLTGYTKTTEVRSKFALDPTSVTINTGTLKFESNTIIIDSTNFKLDKYGNVIASGIFRCQNNKTGDRASLSTGALNFSSTSTRLESTYDCYGITLRDPDRYNAELLITATDISIVNNQMVNGDFIVAKTLAKIEDDGSVLSQIDDLEVTQIKASRIQTRYLTADTIDFNDSTTFLGNSNVRWLYDSTLGYSILISD